MSERLKQGERARSVWHDVVLRLAASALLA